MRGGVQYSAGVETPSNVPRDKRFLLPGRLGMPLEGPAEGPAYSPANIAFWYE